MKAVEFTTKIENNSIRIPDDLMKELRVAENKTIRVIVLVNNSYEENSPDYRNMVNEQFLRGYDDSDSVYDD